MPRRSRTRRSTTRTARTGAQPSENSPHLDGLPRLETGFLGFPLAFLEIPVDRSQKTVGTIGSFLRKYTALDRRNLIRFIETQIKDSSFWRGFWTPVGAIGQLEDAAYEQLLARLRSAGALEGLRLVVAIRNLDRNLETHYRLHQLDKDDLLVKAYWRYLDRKTTYVFLDSFEKDTPFGTWQSGPGVFAYGSGNADNFTPQEGEAIFRRIMAVAGPGASLDQWRGIAAEIRSIPTLRRYAHLVDRYQLTPLMLGLVDWARKLDGPVKWSADEQSPLFGDFNLDRYRSDIYEIVFNYLVNLQTKPAAERLLSYANHADPAIRRTAWSVFMQRGTPILVEMQVGIARKTDDLDKKVDLALNLDMRRDRRGREMLLDLARNPVVTREQWNLHYGVATYLIDKHRKEGIDLLFRFGDFYEARSIMIGRLQMLIPASAVPLVQHKDERSTVNEYFEAARRWWRHNRERYYFGPRPKGR